MSSPDGSPDHSPDFTPPAPEELAALLPQYRIDRLIAAGGMGAVYRGEHRELERPVALKVLPPEFARDSESIDRFRTEAKAMARLTHPHIPSVFDFDVVSGICYLVMEYVEGSDVHAMIHRRQLTPELTVRLLAQVCDALDFAHARNVVHGDIKPANILVNTDGQAKLADFGLARLAGHDDGDGEHLPESMGTLEYTAPEIFEPGGRRGPLTDIYAIGPVLHEMLTGVAPQGEFVLPAAGLGLDPRLDTIIAKCMEIDPAARWQSIGDIRDLLQAILARPQRAAAPGTTAPVRVFRPVRKPVRGRAGVRPPVRSAAHPPVLSPGVRPPGTGRRHRRTGSPGMLIAGILLAAVLAYLTFLFVRQRREAAASPPPVPESRP